MILDPGSFTLALVKANILMKSLSHKPPYQAEVRALNW